MNILIIITGDPQGYWNQKACLCDPELPDHLYRAKSGDKGTLIRTKKNVYFFQNSPREIPNALYAATTALAQMATRGEIPDKSNLIFPTPSNYGNPEVQEQILSGIKATIKGTSLLPIALPPPPPEATPQRNSRIETKQALREMAGTT